MSAYTYLDLAYDVLKAASKPLTYQEVWSVGKERGLDKKLKTLGKTPWQTLGSRLYVEVRDNNESRFMKVGKRPARFFLKERASELAADAVAKIEMAESRTKPETRSAYHERDLHPLLTYFAFANPTFNRGRQIVTKTIFHERSQRSGYNEWIHPDIVGFHLPLEDWRSDVIEFNRLLDNNALRLFSFEMKKGIGKGNYREAYFQAVSNSSWAHEGYLVAAEIHQDDELLAELERLASSFGIGIIQLDPRDIDGSSILYPARARTALDWETINKLCEENAGFETFLRDVKTAVTMGRIYRAEFDPVLTEIDEYVRTKLKIAQ